MVRNRILKRIVISGGPAFVSIMKPAYFGNPKDDSHLRRLHGPSIWRILPKRKMTSRAVVILEIRMHVAPERALIHDDNMVQAFSTYGADEPFHIWARVRIVDASPANIDLNTLHMVQDGISEGFWDQ